MMSDGSLLLPGALALLATFLAAKLAQLFGQLQDARQRRQLALRKRRQMAERFKEETEEMARRVEELGPSITQARAELAEMEEERKAAEAELHALDATPRARLMVFDRHTLSDTPLWEVDVCNPDFLEVSPGRGERDPLVQAWKRGRVYLVSAPTPAEARRRCAARYPGSLGYVVGEAGPFRLALQPTPAAR